MPFELDVMRHVSYPGCAAGGTHAFRDRWRNMRLTPAVQSEGRITFGLDAMRHASYPGCTAGGTHAF